MATENIADLIAKDFVTVKLDSDRGVGAKDIRKRYISEEPGLPWFAFLDVDGKCLIHSSGSNGHNIGHPVRSEEIAHFRTMFETVKKHLTNNDIKVLIQSLKAFNRAEGLPSADEE